jgi:hypothetical protein
LSLYGDLQFMRSFFKLVASLQRHGQIAVSPGAIRIPRKYSLDLALPLPNPGNLCQSPQLTATQMLSSLSTFSE